MTFSDIVRAMLRRWHICLVIVLSFVYISWNLGQNSGCFTSDTVIVFTRPQAATLEPDNGTEDTNVISFAGAIADQVTGGHTTPLYASSDAPIYGAGLRQEVSVSVPNVGGQWTISFTEAEIDVQIVGPTQQWVERQQRSVLAQISAATANQQSKTSARGHISARIEPLSTQISHVQIDRSSLLLALGAIGLAACLCAATASILLERLIGHVRGRRDARRARLFAATEIGALS